MKTPLDFYQWVYHIRKAVEKNDTFTLVGLHEAHSDLMTCPNYSDEELVFIKAYEHVFNKEAE